MLLIGTDFPSISLVKLNLGSENTEGRSPKRLFWGVSMDRLECKSFPLESIFNVNTAAQGIHLGASNWSFKY